MKILMAEHTHFDALMPVGCHQIAKVLARQGHQVTYVSSCVTPLHLANLFGSKAKETEKRFRNWIIGGHEYPGGLCAYVPLSLLPYRRNFLLDNGFVAQHHPLWTLPGLVGWIKKRGPFDAMLVGDPKFIPLIDRLQVPVNILRLTDNVLGFEDVPRSVAGLLAQAGKKCDRVIVTAKPLVRLMEEQYGIKDAAYVPNGVDLDRFAQAPPGMPEDLKAIPEPRAVYIGAIDRWFDAPLLASVAGKNPKVSFVLIGPPRIDLSGLKELKNVHVLGGRPYESLPQYLGACQVGIIPFQNSDLVRSVSPLKLYEYMACALPVVSIEWDELKSAGSPAYLARNAEDFSAGLLKALGEKNTGEKYREFARKNSWTNRVGKILGLIQEVQKAKTLP